MSGWDFANEHPIVMLLCVSCVATCVASCVKSIARAFSGKGKVAKLEIKTPRADAKSTEKAH